MFFKPKFCCNCGEAIERDQWRLWTSRRFCELCETEFKGQDLIPKAIVACALLVGVAGIGAGFRGSGEIGRAADSSASRTTARSLVASDKIKRAHPDAVVEKNESDVSGEQTRVTSEQPQPPKKSSEQKVFYCGATTKKGSPCSRKVKTKGFCWQHAKAATRETTPSHSRPTASF